MKKRDIRLKEELGTELEGLHERDEAEKRMEASGQFRETLEQIELAEADLDELEGALQSCRDAVDVLRWNEETVPIETERDIKAEYEAGDEKPEEDNPVERELTPAEQVMASEVGRMTEEIESYRGMLKELESRADELETLMEELSPEERERLADLESSEAWCSIMSDLPDADFYVRGIDIGKHVERYADFNSRLRTWLGKAEEIYKNNPGLCFTKDTTRAGEEWNEYVKKERQERDQKLRRELQDAADKLDDEDKVLSRWVRLGFYMSHGPNIEVDKEKEQLEEAQEELDEIVNLQNALLTGTDRRLEKLDEEDLDTALEYMKVAILNRKRAIGHCKRSIASLERFEKQPGSKESVERLAEERKALLKRKGEMSHSRPMDTYLGKVLREALVKGFQRQREGRA